MTTPTPLPADALRDAVAMRYGAVARDATIDAPFPVGRAYAEAVGYPPDVLDRLPPSAVATFTGVTYLPGWIAFRAGQQVVDLGCGAGVDTLIAAMQVGPEGRVTAVDLAPEMVELTRQHAHIAGFETIDVRQAAVESLPLPSASADVVMANGVFNLAAETETALAEAYRVLKPGGTLVAAEIVLTQDIPLSERNTLDDWFR